MLGKIGQFVASGVRHVHTTAPKATKSNDRIKLAMANVAMVAFGSLATVSVYQGMKEASKMDPSKAPRRPLPIK